MKNFGLYGLAIFMLIFSTQRLAGQPKSTPKPKPTQSVKPKSDSLAQAGNPTKSPSIQKVMTQVEKDSMDVMKHSAVTQACTYMSALEKDIIWYLNVARMYPQWYLYFFLKNPSTENEKSLYNTMKGMKSASKTLLPNKELYESAKCHAITSGKAGYIGHERQSPTCKSNFNGECCQYGYNEASKVVLDLLIDEGVPSLGHRKIILDTGYTRIGVSVQEHKTYRYNAVLDFGD